MSRIAAGILAGALLWACVVCARWGLADLAIADVMGLEAQVVDRLARTGVGATPQEAEALFGTLKFAQQLDPANPAVAEHFGQLHFLGLVSAAPNDSGHTSTLTPYLRAVRLRPTSGYAWANFAWAKYHLGQVDQEFYRALKAAMRMGPWEPEVQYVVLDLGLALWDEMPAELRPMTLGIAQNARRRFESRVLEIAQRRGRVAALCLSEGFAGLVACNTRPR